MDWTFSLLLLISLLISVNTELSVEPRVAHITLIEWLSFEIIRAHLDPKFNFSSVSLSFSQQVHWWQNLRCCNPIACNSGERLREQGQVSLVLSLCSANYRCKPPGERNWQESKCSAPRPIQSLAGSKQC